MQLRTLIIVTTLLCATLAALSRSEQLEPQRQHQSRADTLHRLAHALEDGGLAYRPDVVVQVSGQPAAWGFSAPGCNGLLLLTILPQTAQSWAHVLPAVSRTDYDESYIYQDKVLTRVPSLRRLKNSLINDLGRPAHDPLHFALIGLAEKGHCGLTARATALLQAYVARSHLAHHIHTS